MVTWHWQIRTICRNASNTHPNITFTYEASTALPFLDVLIKINNDSTIYTTVYCKPTDRHSHWHYESNHPINLKHSIFFSKFLRYKRICAHHRDFTKCSKELTHRFLKKGKPMTITYKQWLKVINIQIVNLLKSNHLAVFLLFTHATHPSNVLMKP